MSHSKKILAGLPEENCSTLIYLSRAILNLGISGNQSWFEDRAGHDLISIAPRGLGWPVGLGFVSGRSASNVLLGRRRPTHAERNSGLIEFALDGIDPAALVETENIVTEVQAGSLEA